MSEPELCDPDALLARMRAGDLAALETSSRCYGERMLAVGRRRCRDAEQARDAVQDALLAAGENLEAFRGEGSVEGWLVRMVTNACHRMRRGRKNDPALHAPLDQQIVFAGGGPEAEFARGEAMQVLATALAALDPRDRTLILLTDGEGYTAPELADQLNMTAQAVRSRLSRARRRLRSAVPDEFLVA